MTKPLITNKNKDTNFTVEQNNGLYTLIYGLNTIIMETKNINKIKDYINSFKLFPVKNETSKALII